ncbi:hypothetical protein [Burkholderia ubonensis]|uniref:hypothetical protein n=1 Tax=Burkholderia ubonensis TaxID=101571 RepID=UPI0018DF3E1C|nr:hypothetical protein [Burkholderia ubonensis]
MKGRYADFDLAVATYNQALVTALSEVAMQVVDMRGTTVPAVAARWAAIHRICLENGNERNQSAGAQAGRCPPHES